MKRRFLERKTRRVLRLRKKANAMFQASLCKLNRVRVNSAVRKKHPDVSSRGEWEKLSEVFIS